MRRLFALLYGPTLAALVACGADATSQAARAPVLVLAAAATPSATEWTHPDAIASLRRWLRTCSRAWADVPASAMRAWPPPGHPDADLATAEPPGLAAGVPWPTGAWLVVTPVGRWWVWPDYPPIRLDAPAPAENRC
jgi:hypothetical protein